jgi:hypothetical protein
MAKQYYYLISSLPLLRFDAPAPFSSARFLRTVAEQAGQKLADDLERLSLAPSGRDACATERFWNERETYIRNYLLRHRTADTSEAAPWLRPCPRVSPSLDHQLKEAVAAGNPLERERCLDLLRWQQLDEVLLGRPFTADALAVYRLRLLMLEKWRRHAVDKGRKIFDTLVDKATAQARTKQTSLETNQQDHP